MLLFIERDSDEWELNVNSRQEVLNCKEYRFNLVIHVVQNPTFVKLKATTAVA